MKSDKKSDKKSLLIIERSKAILTSTDDNKFVLEGTFGEIGVKNKNQRIYSEDEYIPQIESLQSKISTSKLLGELDHPKQFDISLVNVSHVIEDLHYDKDSKLVKGRIRLLNTPKGKIAQDLVNDGIPLHISSRAAGSVDESGNVTIKKLFTYDLVADPGFENAELNRVNEAYGFENSDDFFIYEIDDKNTESLDDKYKNNDSIMEKQNSVTVEDFDKYSTYVKDKLSTLESKLAEINNTTEGYNGDFNPEKMINYVNTIAEKFNKLGNYVKYVAENVDKTISHQDHLVESVGRIQDYVGYVANELNSNIDTAKNLEESLDAVINKTVILDEELASNLEYTRYIANEADKGLQYMEHIAEKADYGLQYSEHLAVKIEESIIHGNYIASNLNDTISYTQYVKENFDTLVSHNNHIANGVNNIIDTVTTNSIITKEVTPEINTVTEAVTEVTTVLENTTTNNDYKQSLSEKLNLIIESAKKQTAGYMSTDYNFLNYLDSSRKNQFMSIDEGKKNEILNSIKEKGYKTTQDVVDIFEAVVNPASEKIDFIKNMPISYKESWENLSESQQNAIKAQSKYYPLNTVYQINNFWATRDLRPVKVKFQPLNENANNEEFENVKNEKMKYYEEEMKRRFNK